MCTKEEEEDDDICSVNTILYMQMAARIHSKVVKVRERTYCEVTYSGFL